MKHPFVLAYGMGVDSTAIIVGLVARKMRPDLIMFADVGGERDETYAYLAVINAYLEFNGFPKVTVVKYVPKNFKHWPPYYTLEENCLTNGTLPSKAFGFGSCSLKWKAAPQHAYVKKWAPAVEAWARGEKVLKAIGYDCSTRDVQRREKADKFTSTYQDTFADFYEYWYPLQEWGWDRDRCMAEIATAGLPVPAKSSCFFCPAMKPAEVDTLPKDKLKRIVLMETRAKPRLRTVEGLWRKATKKRPGSMTEYIAKQGLLTADEIANVQRVPTELRSYQESFAAGETKQAFTQFVTEILAAPKLDAGEPSPQQDSVPAER